MQNIDQHQTNVSYLGHIRDRNGAGIRGEESGRGEAGASYDGASWGEAGRGEATTGRSGAGRDND